MALIFFFFTVTAAIKFTQEINPEGIGPTPRDSASIAFSSKNNIFYVFGGKSKTELDDLWMFDMNFMQWKVIYPNSPSPRKKYLESRSKAGGFYYDEQDEFCIYGGNSEKFVFNDLWCFNTKYRMWKDKNPYNEPPPMLNFASNHFINNSYEYFVVVGHQVSEIIIDSFM